MAGESSRDYARRQREKAERHARAAERFERGAEGESATAAVLQPLLEQGWVVLHDVAWPGRPRANIDHVVIGPGGVFVIDSKNWSGAIAVRDQVLRQNGRSREMAVVGAAEAALAVSVAMGGLPVTGALCFVRDDAIEGWARDVMVCSTVNLGDMLLSRPATLRAEAVVRFARRAAVALPPATEPRSGHVSTKPSAPNRSLAKRGRPAKAAKRRPVRRTSASVQVIRALLMTALCLAAIWAVTQYSSQIASALTDIFISGSEPEEAEVGASASIHNASAGVDARVR